MVKTITLLCVLVSTLGYRYLLDRPGRRIPQDFTVYWRAWQNFSQGITPYNAFEDLPFKYSPAFLSLFSFFPSSLSVAWEAFGLLSLLALAASALLTFPDRAALRSPRGVAAVALGFLLAWKGILECLDYGQWEFILLLTVLAAGRLTLRTPWVAGILLGRLPLVKLPWLIFPALFCGHQFCILRRWPQKLLVGVTVSTGVWVLVWPALFFGPAKALALTRQWLASLALQPQGVYLDPTNQSIWFWLPRIFGSTGLGSAVTGILILLLIRALFQSWYFEFSKKPHSQLLDFVPALLLGHLLNPLAWRWGSVLALSVGISIVLQMDRQFWKTPRSWSLWAAGAAAGALFLLQQTPVVRLLGYSHWVDLHRYGVVTAYWVVLFILSLRRRDPSS